MNIQRIIIFFGYLLLLAILAGCGYHLSIANKKVRWDIKSVCVPMFHNTTFQAHPEAIFTSSIRDKIKTGGILKLTDCKNADAILEGVITSVKNEVRTETSPGTDSTQNSGGLLKKKRLATSYNTTISVHLKLYTRANGKILWERSFSGLEPYDASARTSDLTVATANVLYNRSAMIKSAYSIAEDTMQRAYNLMETSF